ncbi:6-phosphofructo-2-kinase [Scheffersomyces amazonensis]|uniref:6-phosphofructo-2-kinase n=1 Tax=Scheffersomyces amazonensis TaxID=1078765 RepID=UPI00315DE59C
MNPPKESIVKPIDTSTSANHKKVIFDLFDFLTTPNSATPTSYSKLKHLESIEMNSHNISTSPTTSSSMKIIDSTSSINSLFDPIPSSNLSTNVISTNPQTAATTATTATTSPINSKSNLRDLEFSSILNQKLLQEQQHRHEQEVSQSLIIMLVGLPASGKSTVAKQFKQFVNTNTIYKTEIYNAGNIRRINHSNFDDSDYFNPNNIQGKLDRELFADITLTNLITDLTSGTTQIGILDATNTTLARRQRMISQMNVRAPNTRIIILDVQCFDAKLLNFNINGKAHNSDYRDKDYNEAISDFKKRTEHYYQVYEPICTEELSAYPIDMYVKIVNAGETFEFLNVKDEFESETETEPTSLFKIFNDFKAHYFTCERTRYIEAVNAFYHKEKMNNEYY